MRIAVSASIATDHLMTFPGRFGEQLLPDQLASLSVSFLVNNLEVRRGGVAGNISFGLGQLGERPLLVGAVGSDFAEYASWLTDHGVDTSGVSTSATQATARFTCFTDSDQNQIAGFYPGAMSEARDIDLSALSDFDLMLIGPNDPEAMVRHTAWCRESGVPFAADPSQQLTSLEADAVTSLVDGAALLFGNTYEAALLERKTGWSADDVLAKVGIRLTTHGADGIVIEQSGESLIEVGVVSAEQVADPTGVGDAFRAGFLAGRSDGLSLEHSAQLGALLATLCVETVGPQEYTYDEAQAATRLAAAYGEDAASTIAARTRRP